MTTLVARYRDMRDPTCASNDWIIQQALLLTKQRFERNRILIDSPRAMREFLELRLAGEPNEVFAVVFLDASHRVIRYEELFRGTVNATSVYPRVIVSKVLETNAVAVVFAHNHPSGQTEPSRADEVLTNSLKSLLAQIDAKVLDHFIVGDGPAFSFAEHGLL